MNGASEITDRSAKLLRLACSTGPDGEKLAALNRLAAIAAAHDVDWDRVLANGKAPDLTEAQLQRVYDAGYERGFEDGKQENAPERPDWSPAAPPPRSLDYVRQILEAARIADGAYDLNDFEAQFSDSIRQKINRYGSRSRVSEKQWVCLERLAERLEKLGYLEW